MIIHCDHVYEKCSVHRVVFSFIVLLQFHSPLYFPTLLNLVRTLIVLPICFCWKKVVLLPVNDLEISCHCSFSVELEILQDQQYQLLWYYAREISCLVEILLSLMHSRILLMVICWHYRMPFNGNHILHANIWKLSIYASECRLNKMDVQVFLC